MPEKTVIHWFRHDLRLTDNPAFAKANTIGKVLPIFIFDENTPKDFKWGEASKVWLHHSLQSLNESLDNKICFFKGDPQKIISELVKEQNIAGVFWNRCYEPWQRERDEKIKTHLKKQKILVESQNGSLLWEPWEPLKSDGTPYKVFTPFYQRGCLGFGPPRKPLPKPRTLNLISKRVNTSQISDYKLLPKIRWDEDLISQWQVSEKGAKTKLTLFLKNKVDAYKKQRDFPAAEYHSKLSPYLHWGEISPHQIWYQAKEKSSGKDLEHFLSELGWREFCHSLLYHFPELPKKNLQEKFDGFPWGSHTEYLECWQKGQTGYPIVDAGMRELWQTGFMHNRVRMIVGSFLVKNLLIHWHHGERWFWDCLVDASLANNSANWQWIAGCGADAAPYFRIFNPTTQGKKFDTDGEYTKKYVPELKDLPNKYLFEPWNAPKDVLETAKIELGKTYPKPIVDLKESRERALDAYSTIKTSTS